MPVAAVACPAAAPVARPRRRAAARRAERQEARQAVHATPLAPLAPPAPPVAPLVPAQEQPLYETVLAVTETALRGHGHPRPTCKRLALLVAGLLVGEHGQPAAIARAAHGLRIGTAQREASVARRVGRLLDDPQLDPTRLLPDLAATLLPVLLADLCRTHDHTIGTPAHAAHHARWIGPRLIVDETTQADQTHILVVGLAYRGTVVPLAVATWPQNVPQPAGDYWGALGRLLWAVYDLLPPVLRDQVLVLADRGYGVPTMLDLLAALGWHWVVRVQGQTRVRFPDGREQRLRTLVPQPGTCWTGYSTPAEPAAPPAAEPAPWAVFKQAGWRSLHVVATWAPAQAEPWLLVTTLAARPDRWRDYAARWAIERLFLAWKSHGWDLEAAGVPDPPRLARLLTGYVVATWWLLAAALPRAQAHLADLAAAAVARTGRLLTRPVQLRLPLFPPTRPWPAKYSLLTQGRATFHATNERTTTPPLCWAFPDWDAPTWSVQCHQVYHDPAS